MLEYTYKASIERISHEGWPGASIIERFAGAGYKGTKFEVCWVKNPADNSESLTFKFPEGTKGYVIRDSQAQSTVHFCKVRNADDPNFLLPLKWIRSVPSNQIGQVNGLGFVLPPSNSSMFIKRSEQEPTAEMTKSTRPELSDKFAFPLDVQTPQIAYADKEFKTLRMDQAQGRDVEWNFTYSNSKVPSKIEFVSHLLGDVAFKGTYQLVSSREVKAPLKLNDIVDKSYSHQIGINNDFISEHFDPNRTDYFQAYRQQTALSNLATRVKAQPSQWMGLWITAAIVVLLVGIGIWRFRKSR